MNKSNIEAAKVALAEYEVRMAEATRARLQEEHYAASRWLVASLFAVNAGAIIAIISSERMDPLRYSPAIILYLTGLFGVFVMAVMGQIAHRLMAPLIHRWGLYWTSFIATRQPDDDHEKKIKSEILAAERIGRFSRICGLISMAAFIVATITALVILLRDIRP